MADGADGVDGEYRALIGELAGLVRMAHGALAGATAALADPAGGGEGITDAEKALAELRERIEEDAAAVPGGRAGVVAGVHVGCEVEGLGQVAQRLLEAAWARQERQPFDGPLRSWLLGVADAALGLVARAADALESGLPGDAAEMTGEPSGIGREQRLLYESLLRSEDADPVDTADLVMLSCCYRQCAGHAASIARHADLFASALS